MCKVLGQDRTPHSAPGDGARPTEQVALALHCAVSPKLKFRRQAEEEGTAPATPGRQCPGPQQGQAAAAKNEKTSVQRNLVTQELTDRKSRKQLFLFIIYVGFELYGFKLFLLRIIPSAAQCWSFWRG